MSWQDYVQATRYALAKLGTKVAKDTAYGYGRCEYPEEKELYELYHVARMLRDQELTDSICICKEEEDLIISNIHRVLGPDCCQTMVKDFTREENPDKDRWILQNPYCLAYDYTADYLESLCKRISIDFKVVKQKCEDIGINIDITNHSVCEAIDLAIDIEKHECPTDIDVNIDLHQCIIDVEIIVAKTNCQVNVETLARLYNCGVDIDTIIDKLNCGVELDVIVGDAINCPLIPSSSVSASPSPSSSASASPSPSEEAPLEFTVGVDDSTVCYYTDVTLEITSASHPGATYTWDFGVDAVPDSDTGEGPHTIQYTSSGTKTVTVTGVLDDLFTVEEVVITVSSCPGNITGTTTNVCGTGLGGINVRLYNDVNEDGVPDDATIVRSVFSTGAGSWSIVGLTPGNYVLQVTPSSSYNIATGIDTSDDSDEVPNTVTTDVYIPVTIRPQEIDANNNFVFSPKPGTITGTVLDDLGAAIVGATVSLHADDNQDGAADGAAITSVVTNGSGAYSFTNVTVGCDGTNTHYVIVLTVPTGYSMVSGIDTSNDSDVVPNTDTTNNIIPCTLAPNETDANNNFIIQAD